MRSPFDFPAPRRVRPGEHPAWDEALALLNRDVATALPEQKPLRLVAQRSEEGGPEHVYVALDNGEWWGQPVEPASAGTPLNALAAVAEAVQDTVTECLWRAWPICTEHDLGMHLAEADGRPVWRCAGSRDGRDPQHVRAAVGELDALKR
ncbi:hypothetical protein ACFY1L_14385 [Streptomyces sp. NPDC001663]|uniref:hypothetical protein n=1 Tax=Streptomyces sp. NPDC001663 TaxID=3364597 RepID=UPI0036AE4162